MSRPRDILRDPIIAFHRVYVDVTGSITAALMLSQAVYWTPRTNNTDGWFYKTQEEWEQETGLSRREQESARKKLRQLKIMEEERKGIPAQLFYRVDMDHLEFLVMYTLDNTNDPIQNGGKRQTGMAESAKHSYTETTPETTAETISGGEHQAAEFEVFWNHYPRKEGKADARKAWMKLNPDPSLCQTIGVAMIRQTHNNWKDRAKQYIPLPASWLRGERWEDEIIQPQGPKVELIDRHGNFTVEGAAAHARGEI